MASNRTDQERKAFERLLQATKDNPSNSKAWCSLASCYKDGTGIAQDAKQAFACYLKATETDPKNYLAQDGLGWCYENGFGVEKNVAKAEECFWLAVRHGSIDRLREMKRRLKQKEKIDVSALAKQARRDWFRGDGEWKKEAEDTLKFLEDNPGCGTAKSFYYLATYLAIAKNDTNLIADFFNDESNAEFFLNLFQEDLQWDILLFMAP